MAAARLQAPQRSQRTPRRTRGRRPPRPCTPSRSCTSWPRPSLSRSQPPARSRSTRSSTCRRSSSCCSRSRRSSSSCRPGCRRRQTRTRCSASRAARRRHSRRETDTQVAAPITAACGAAWRLACLHARRSLSQPLAVRLTSPVLLARPAVVVHCEAQSRTVSSDPAAAYVSLASRGQTGSSGSGGRGGVSTTGVQPLLSGSGGGADQQQQHRHMLQMASWCACPLLCAVVGPASSERAANLDRQLHSKHPPASTPVKRLPPFQHAGSCRTRAAATGRCSPASWCWAWRLCLLSWRATTPPGCARPAPRRRWAAWRRRRPTRRSGGRRASRGGSSSGASRARRRSTRPTCMPGAPGGAAGAPRQGCSGGGAAGPFCSTPLGRSHV